MVIYIDFTVIQSFQLTFITYPVNIKTKSFLNLFTQYCLGYLMFPSKHLDCKALKTYDKHSFSNVFAEKMPL